MFPAFKEPVVHVVVSVVGVVLLRVDLGEALGEVIVDGLSLPLADLPPGHVLHHLVLLLPVSAQLAQEPATCMVTFIISQSRMVTLMIYDKSQMLHL